MIAVTLVKGRMAGLLIAALLSLGAAQAQTPDSAQPAAVASDAAAAAAPVDHVTFSTPTAAVKALVSAVRRGDRNRIISILGPGSEDLVNSGDPVADRKERESLQKAYRAKHALIADGPDRMVLTLGTKGWQMPTPLVKTDGRWEFDGAAGVQELIYRRIGSNELGAIAVCNGIVDAEADYLAANPEKSPTPTYAKMLSDPGRRNGLYWKSQPGEPPSPLGDLVAEAVNEGYTSGAGSPYHGYFFRMVMAQGPAAKGGAKSYVVDGAMTGGFAVVAWPAIYRASGVMTFIVNQDGVVYQKDLGDDTEKLAEALAAYDPDSTWTPVDTDN